MTKDRKESVNTYLNSCQVWLLGVPSAFRYLGMARGKGMDWTGAEMGGGSESVFMKEEGWVHGKV